ncbi:MAG: hypothetical protein COT85_04215 [Chlamydiae bacterium CG10_big_fil_rev_8_21_14_0_10_42_34]|nr:MAG: hypothetical protein COT85_04215 [Chlamydiae bacterium CG10_big_fil_rev_8_21_14_0_10_42_34]
MNFFRSLLLFFTISNASIYAACEENSIQAIVLVPSKTKLLSPEELKDLEGVAAFDVDVPGGTTGLRLALKPIIKNKSFNYETAKKVKEATTKYFYDQGDPFVLIHIPSQEMSTKVLQLIVIRAQVGTIKIEGNKYTSDKLLTKHLPIESGDRINLQELDRSLYLINLNPFRRVDLIYSPGQDLGSTDITMYVQDRRPYRFYTGFNNSGVDTTNRQRWLAGFTLGNLFDTDQLLSFQYMTSYHFKRFQAFTIQYIAPTYNGQLLTVYGGYSELSAKGSFPLSKSKGKSYQSSFRYEVPAYTSQGMVRKWYVGFDFKGMNNTIEFSQTFPTVGKTTNLSQFIAGYRETHEMSTYRIDMNLEVDWSPGKIFPNETNADYNSLRPGAKNHWLLARGSVTYNQDLPLKFNLLLSARGQVSSQNLLPSEQIGLGGFDTVRGYTERQLNYDTGILTTVEAHSPKIPVVSAIRGKKMNDALYFLLFMDFGWGVNHNLLPGEPKSDFLLGTGPGIRYNLNPYVSASLDWGIKLHQQDLFIGGGSMLYFNVLMSY